MLQVKKIVGKVFSSNMYLLYEEGNANCYLIDIGDSSALAEELPDGMNVKGLFLTHSHFDHMAGINWLCKLFPECKVYTSEYGKKALYSDKMNFSLYHERPVVYEGDLIEILHDGDEINLFDGIQIHATATPGHCPSCLTYYTDEYIFTGDSYIMDVPVITKLPGGNRELSEKSVYKILSLSKSRQILSGHDKDKWVPIF